MVLLGAAVEVWVRATWNPARGTPGLLVSDPVRGQRLAPGYNGWFAGVPVRINNLGLRADRDATLAKRPDTFRILVLGDSVTFGHGSVHTYPELLEGMLREWRPDVDWQVWNAAVPGYNTSQELAQLLEVGPSFRPDLVIVGFFENDLIDNGPIVEPSWIARIRSRAVSFVQRHMYSMQLYKRVYLSTAWWLSKSTAYHRRLEHLDTESALLGGSARVHEWPEQRLTPYERLSVEEVAARRCVDGERPDPAALAEMQQEAGWPAWVEAVRGFQRLHEQRRYRVLFFLNVIPPICDDHDFFHPGGTREVNELYLSVMRGVTPALSTFDTFLRRMPSQMPAARGHAIGNSNMAKAEILFEFLRDETFPAWGAPLVTRGSGRRPAP